MDLFSHPFFVPEEAEIVERFLRDGYIVVPLENVDFVTHLRGKLFKAATEMSGQPAAKTEDEFFDRTQEFVALDRLNEMRVKLISRMAEDPEIRPGIYQSLRKYIHWIVGNELSMQRSANLSIQLPADSSSLLPVHSDVWSGNSPYEVVAWVPLVDCYKTKSMFILNRNDSEKVYADFPRYSKLSAESFFREIEKNVHWLDVPRGHAVIFSHVLVHGNRVNAETTARWTMNVRFKGLLSPYWAKEVGESFQPITVRPITRIGYAYRTPEVDGR